MGTISISSGGFRPTLPESELKQEEQPEGQQSLDLGKHREQLERQESRDPTKQGEQGNGPLLQRSEIAASQGTEERRRTAPEGKENPARSFMMVREPEDGSVPRGLVGLRDQLVRGRSAGDVAQLQQELMVAPWSMAAEVSGNQLPIEGLTVPHAPPPLWSLPAAPGAAASSAGVERSLQSLLKEADLPPGEKATRFVGRASMDQMVMVLATLASKVTSTNAQELLKSQKTQADSSNKLMELRMAKMDEEHKKAEEQQNNAKKGGIFGQIFNWVAVAFEAITCVVAPFLAPIMIVAMTATVASAVMDTVAFAMGDKAPGWLKTVAIVLSVASMLVVPFSSIPKMVGKMGSKLAQLGLRGIMKSAQKACSKLLSLIKSIPTKVGKALHGVKDSAGRAGKGLKQAFYSPEAAQNLIKKPFQKSYQGAKDLASTGVKNVYNKGSEMVRDLASGNTEARKRLVGDLAKSGRGITNAASGTVGATIEKKGANIRAELGRIAAENQFISMLLDAYQSSRKQIQQEVKIQFDKQGDSMEEASQMLQESGSLKGRIASSLA